MGNGSSKRPLFPRLESRANAHNGVAARTGFGAFDARERDFPGNRAMVRRRVTFRPKGKSRRFLLHRQAVARQARAASAGARHCPSRNRNGGRREPAGSSAGRRTTTGRRSRSLACASSSTTHWSGMMRTGKNEAVEVKKARISRLCSIRCRIASGRRPDFPCRGGLQRSI
jgi:hypothetical protein